jgi:hypothetical protein
VTSSNTPTLDLRAAELCQNGGKTVRLSEQPFRILTMLLERPGEVITREELRQRLWPDDTIVEFEHSISAAMNRLRQRRGKSPRKLGFLCLVRSERKRDRWVNLRLWHVCRRCLWSRCGSGNRLRCDNPRVCKIRLRRRWARSCGAALKLSAHFIGAIWGKPRPTASPGFRNTSIDYPSIESKGRSDSPTNSDCAAIASADYATGSNKEVACQWRNQPRELGTQRSWMRAILAR